MKRSLLLFASTAGIMCLAGTQARAGLIPAPTAQWSYNFNPSQKFVSADAPGTGSVTFTNEKTNSATGSSDVVVTQLRVSSSAPISNPDMLSGGNGNYGFGMVLTDKASGQSATLTFTGKLSGSFSSSNANVTNLFTGANVTNGFTGTPQTVTLGTNVYTVFLDRYAPPGPPTEVNSGSISAHVTVQTDDGHGHTGGITPEPSSLILSFLGVTFAGVASWRQRRRTLASLLA